MWKILAICFVLLMPLSAVASTDEYDSSYCKDPEETKKWTSILEKNPNSDAVAALHALWIGLCVKVETQSLTTARANQIFEDFRWGLIESSQNKGSNEPDASM